MSADKIKSMLKMSTLLQITLSAETHLADGVTNVEQSLSFSDSIHTVTESGIDGNLIMLFKILMRNGGWQCCCVEKNAE
jgi:hypothetical protein